MQSFKRLELKVCLKVQQIKWNKQPKFLHCCNVGDLELRQTGRRQNQKLYITLRTFLV